MKLRYDQKASPFNFYSGQAIWLHDPVCKPSECNKLRKKWRRPFIIDCLTTHNVKLHNPDNGKILDKSVHVNRIKPCYQRDDIPKDSEDMEDIPIVEVRYPDITARQETTLPAHHIKPTTTTIREAETQPKQIHTDETPIAETQEDEPLAAGTPETQTQDSMRTA